MRNLHGRIEFERERERNATLSEEVQRLKHELDQTKLE